MEGIIGAPRRNDVAIDMSMNEFRQVVRELVDREELLRLREELERRPGATRAEDLWLALLGTLTLGYLEEAEHYARELRSRDAEDLETLSTIAHIARLQGDLVEAETLLRSILDRSGASEINRAEWATELGEVLFASGRYEECEALCLADWGDLVAEQLTPTLVKRGVLLARVAVRLGRWVEAVAYYRLALKFCRLRPWGVLYAHEILSELCEVLRHPVDLPDKVEMS